MKGHPPPRRKQVLSAFRRSLLGAIFLGLSGLAFIFGALVLLAIPRSNGFSPAYVMDQRSGSTRRRDLKSSVKSNEFRIDGALEKGLERNVARVGVAGLLDGTKQGPGRMRKEAERKLNLKRKQSRLKFTGGIELRTRKETKDAEELSGQNSLSDVEKGGEGVRSGTELPADESSEFRNPLKASPQHLWVTYAKLARQPVLLSESRLHDPGRISCGGSGTVGFRSWRELARSVEEFDAEWFSEEPDLRALVAAAQNTKPQLERKPSCAVVGNSGRLLQHEYGAEIDDREMVIRFNWGTTKGYEKHVGSRSDVRIYNGPYVSQKQPGEVTIAEIRDPALRQWLRIKKKESATHAAAFDPEFLCHVWDWVGRSGDKPSTGLVGVILALRTCSTVDVFGFHYEDYFDPAIQPHYYDWERPKVGREKAHPFEREYQLYKQLESAGMLRMH